MDLSTIDLILGVMAAAFILFMIWASQPPPAS
jgi:hypothetical protein